MLSKCFRTWQYLCVDCFNIHVGIKCKEKNASRYFRNEYKKVNRFPDVFKKLPDKEESYKSNVKFICRRHKRLSYDEQETKNGAIQVKLPPSSVSKNGTADCRE